MLSPVLLVRAAIRILRWLPIHGWTVSVLLSLLSILLLLLLSCGIKATVVVGCISGLCSLWSSCCS